MGGGGAIASLSGYTTGKHNDCCPTRQHSHFNALFEVFYNSGKIILPLFFKVFIMQLQIRLQRFENIYLLCHSKIEW